MTRPLASVPSSCWALIADAHDTLRFLVLKEETGWSLVPAGYHTQEYASTRPIIESVQAGLGLPITVLTCLDAVPSDLHPRRYYACFTTAENWQAPADREVRWVTEAEATGLIFTTPEQKAIILRGYRWWRAEETRRVPWSQPAWHTRARTWMLDLADRLAMNPNGPVMQERAWSRSTVLSLPTDQTRLYLKATPRRASYELVISRVLHLRYPDRVPRVLAVDVDECWSLTPDYGGQLLQEQTNLAMWRAALRAYAEMQIDLVGNTPALIALGVPDRNVDQIAAQVDSLMMTPPAGLSTDELERMARLGRPLRHLCYEIMDHAVPLTLVHGDLSPVNIVARDEGGFYFFDWSDCTISHPFFDLPHCLTDLTYLFPQMNESREILIRAYLEPWTRYEPMDHLRQLVNLAEIIGPLHQALFYERYVLPNIEPAARWEVEPRLLFFLRRLLTAYNAAKN